MLGYAKPSPNLRNIKIVIVVRSDLTIDLGGFGFGAIFTMSCAIVFND
jgi:hypothetical protein